MSGCKFSQDLSWEQGAAKTMTSNLPILSVLVQVAFFLSFKQDVSGEQDALLFLFLFSTNCF